MTRVAIVTGSNKGIGFAIVRALCQQFEGDVFLTARNAERGEAAVEELKKEGLAPRFHQLDINDRSSIERLRDFLQQNYGGIDVLVNNAGIAFKNADPAPFPTQVEVTMTTNFWGTLAACDVLFPLLKPGSRVVHISSMASVFALNGCSAEKQAEVKAMSTMNQVKELMTHFVRDAAGGKHSELGWPNTAYGMTKLGVTAMTPIQQAAFNTDSREDIVVNCCCPGYVDTGMISHKGPLTIDQGADTPVYLALLPPGATSPRGDYVTKRKVTNWKQ